MIDKQRDDLLAERLTQAFDKAVVRMTPHDLYPNTLSVLSMGHECDRNIWYRFRHATAYAPHAWNQSQHKRDIREMIFDVFAEIAKDGRGTWNKTDNPHFSIINGHFTGHTEAIASIRDGEVYADFIVFIWTSPTGAKYRDVSEGGLERGRPDQYAILCALAHNLKIPRAIYVAYNRNDDSSYIEVITADVEVAEKVVKRAESIIYATMPPPRINNSAAWHVCKACPANAMCHPEGKEPITAKSCRTCRNAYPYPNGEWHCGHYNAIIPADYLANGCPDAYIQIEL